MRHGHPSHHPPNTPHEHALHVTAADREPPHWKPFRPRFPRLFKALLALLLLAFALVVVVGQDARLRRTAETAVEVTGIELQTSVHPAIDPGTLIRYRFVVAGITFEGIAVRSWSLASIRAAKVCYEPANPDNQVLVKGSASCP
jgi:hypothetical protein